MTHEAVRAFGPVMVLWFITLAVLGLVLTCISGAYLSLLIFTGSRLPFSRDSNW